MFDVGFPELVLVFIIALLVLGPQRLPKVAAEIGKWVGRARRTATQLRRQLEREIELSDLDPPRPPPAATSEDAAPPPAESTAASEDAAPPSVEPATAPADPPASTVATPTSGPGATQESVDETRHA
jgi:sec-independent protein translocase protein TatB